VAVAAACGGAVDWSQAAAAREVVRSPAIPWGSPAADRARSLRLADLRKNAASSVFSGGTTGPKPNTTPRGIEKRSPQREKYGNRIGLPELCHNGRFVLSE
jgi:hypothetical protein